MENRGLKDLLNPRSVAVIGATDRPQSVGAAVMRNLLAGGFDGPIWPVNLRRPTVGGRTAYPRIADLPGCPDLAVVCTPAPTVPDLIGQLAAAGTRAAIVISAGMEQACPDGTTLRQAMLAAARASGLRILGPNTVGLLLPGIGLNAGFAHTAAAPGHVAFIAQSGALTTAMLDWARSAQVGFSCFASLGDCADIDFGDLLGVLGEDANTSAVLLYIESVRKAPAFMAAARAASRRVPVIAVKAGRNARSAQAAASHTGALAGADDVYEAALRQAGVVRVSTTRELYIAAEMFAHATRVAGDRLAIVSNGGGPAVMAADALVSAGGHLSQLTPATLDALNAALPANWSHANPVDIGGDAPIARYLSALQILLADDTADALLLIHAPTAIVPASDIARACVAQLRGVTRPVITCWMGSAAVEEARCLCRAAGMAAFATPEEAITAFMQAAAWQRLRSQHPVPGPPPPAVDVAGARGILRAAQAQGQTWLGEPEAKAVLAAYAIPVVETRIAADAGEAVRLAGALGFPVALKILSPDITHKSDVGGVALDIESPSALEEAAGAMLRRCRERQPAARLRGFTVQRMVRRPRAHELITGITTDPTFGPVILFGQGGVSVEAVNDKAVALASIDRAQALELIGRTRVSAVLRSHRDRAAADVDAVAQVLLQLARLAADAPEILELDINPLLADAAGVIALDARMRIAPKE
ncbi:MAG TPA: acetate--CoA ligase family protein [Steroidobacteraceae bacterium]|nr:acetate--CoA ligase family protein [Steroidobacteraceae bacterium]